MRKVLILGAGGFIGHQLARRLRQKECLITGVDLTHPEFEDSPAQNFIIGDLRNKETICSIISNNSFDEIYQFAADMGGAGYIFTGDSDADIVSNSALINLNLLSCLVEQDYSPKVFFSSSACIYPQENQVSAENPYCEESSAYPANPDSEYGWEKLFSERLYLSYSRNYHLDVKIARFHNVYGPLGVWNNGKEKFPAAICRKVAEASDKGMIEIWGDGEQTRSFLYIEDCLDGIELLMQSKNSGPLNIGSEEMISINQMAEMVIGIAGKELTLNHIEGPQGVRGRSSHNHLVQQELGWKPKISLKKGMEKTYRWIEERMLQTQFSND